MSDNIVHFSGITKLDMTAERVLKAALEANIKSCVILGYDENDEEYFASSIAAGDAILWLCERFKKHLMDLRDEVTP